ncbi:MAG: recombinase RecA [Lentisphaeria bacterium]|nr:recombinase RecA [Lentisphaeria bacterium]
MAKEPAVSTNEIQQRNLKLALSQIEKEFGKGSIMRLGDQQHLDVPTISTGSLSLDIATGIGGVPRGRIIEIYGPESSGKTTLCLHVIANAQKAGGTCAFVDTEHALDPRYARIIGVDTDNLLVAQPDCGEDALNIAETLVRSNAIDVLIIDAVAALTPKAEIEGEMGDQHVGLQARLMSQALRKLTPIAAKSNTCVIFTNQIREKIGVMFGNPETTTGGRALKFYASMRMEIRRTGVIKSPDGRSQGNKVKVKIAKNKLAAPFQECEFDIMFNEGISRAGSILAVALDMHIIEKRGSWFSFGDTQLGQGAEQTKALLKSDEKLAERIIAEIRKNLPEAMAAKNAEAARNASSMPADEEAPFDESALDTPVDQL